MTSCIRKTKKVLSITKALISRSLFVLHGLICIWRVTHVKNSLIYWCLSGTLPLMVAETLFTLCKKKDREWKWICPSVVLYLATSVPAMWFLELDLMRHRTVMGKSSINKSGRDASSLNGKMISFAKSLRSEEWCKILEQLLLLVLIIGRWLLPKGEITREQLSQLLLVYIGMAADIIELFEAFKEKGVSGNTFLTIVILSLWTASLTQFTLVITATKAKKTRVATTDQTNSTNACCSTEVISILISVCLQDAPFLVLRMLLIFKYNVLSYTNIFFTCKNTLVLVLQFYRLVVLFTITSSERPGHNPTPTTLHSQASLNTLHDAYDSSQSSDASSLSGKNSSTERRVRKLSRRRREMMRQMTEDSARTISSSMDGADTTHSLENEYEAAKTSTSKHSSKSSSGFKTGRRNSATSPKPFKQHTTNSPGKKSTNSQDNYTNNSFHNARKIDKYGHVQKKEHSRKEVQKKIKRFETSEPLNDSDTRDHIISEDSNAASNRRHKQTRTNKATKDARQDSPRSDGANSGGRYAKRTDDLRAGNHQQDQWSSVRDLRSALAFLSETGKCKTVVVRSNEDGKLYVIEDLSS